MKALHKSNSKIKSFIAFSVVCIVAFFMCCTLSTKDEALAVFGNSIVIPDGAGPIVSSFYDVAGEASDTANVSYDGASVSVSFDGSAAGSASASASSDKFKFNHWVWTHGSAYGEQHGTSFGNIQRSVWNSEHTGVLYACFAEQPVLSCSSQQSHSIGFCSTGCDYLYRYSKVNSSLPTFDYAKLQASTWGSAGSSFQIMLINNDLTSAFANIKLNVSAAPSGFSKWRLQNVDDLNEYIDYGKSTYISSSEVPFRFKVIAIYDDAVFVNVNVKTDSSDGGTVESIGSSAAMNFTDKYYASVEPVTVDGIDSLKLTIDANPFPKNGSTSWMYIAKPNENYTVSAWLVDNGSGTPTEYTAGQTFEITQNCTISAVFEGGEDPDPPDPGEHTFIYVNTAKTDGGKIISVGRPWWINTSDVYKVNVSSVNYEGVDSLKLTVKGLGFEDWFMPSWEFIAKPNEGYTINSWELNNFFDRGRKMVNGDECFIWLDSGFTAAFDKVIEPDPPIPPEPVPPEPVPPVPVNPDNPGSIAQTNDAINMNAVISLIALAFISSSIYVVRKRRYNR